MNKIISTRRRSFRLIAPVLGALACAAILGAAATPASAREVDHGRDWRGHERHEVRHDAWRWQRPAFYGYAPGYYPAPVYAPPVYGAPGFNLVIPLNIR
jgi:hypothetical protein